MSLLLITQLLVEGGQGQGWTPLSSAREGFRVQRTCGGARQQPLCGVVRNGHYLGKGVLGPRVGIADLLGAGLAHGLEGGIQRR
jgi:hypothetical protein